MRLRKPQDLRLVAVTACNRLSENLARHRHLARKSALSNSNFSSHRCLIFASIFGT
jgi:hypothetical protein